MNQISNVGILGAGAMGGLYASHFCAGGFNVYSICRSERANRIRSDGLIVNDEQLPINICDIDTLKSDSQQPTMDLVIVAVKHHQLMEALDDVAQVVSDQTIFLSVLNGLDSEESIAGRFGPQRVLYCIALAMDAARDGNRIRFHQAGKLVFGEKDNTHPSEVVLAVQQALDRADLSYETPTDMLRELWWKFMVNVGINQASALLGASYGAFVAPGPARSLMDNLIAEVIATSSHAGVNLDDADVERWYAVLANQVADGKTSMLQDVQAHRPTELEIFAGRVIRMGREYGVPTPYNQSAHDILSFWADQNSLHF